MSVRYLDEPIRALDVPLSLARVHNARLILIERQRKLLECQRARLRDCLVPSKLAEDALVHAKLTPHEAVAEVILDARLAAAPDAARKQRAVALRCLLVLTEANVTVVLHRARVAVRLGHRLLGEESGVVVCPDVALGSPPAPLVCLCDRRRRAALGEKGDKLASAWIK